MFLHHEGIRSVKSQLTIDDFQTISDKTPYIADLK